MRILRYAYKDGTPDGWEFSAATLKKLNLLVGPTGSGKSRFMNSLFNIGHAISHGQFVSGNWSISFQVGDAKYQWLYEGVGSGDSAQIVGESVSKVNQDGSTSILIDRTHNTFLYNGQKLPKLPGTSPALYLLREEDDIQVLHAGFGLIQRRSFWGPDLLEACKMSNFPPDLLQQLQGSGKAAERARTVLLSLPMSARIYALRETEKRKFDDLVDQYKSVFPTVETVDFKDGAQIIEGLSAGKVPVLTIKERHVAHPVLLHDLSSGMQKVLLIMTDVMTVPQESIYLIDEYENSLGTNAVNFLPGFLSDFGGNRQFIITSHHPYLINSTPMKNWLVFRRVGSRVEIQDGENLAHKYGPSKQDAFIQLINDPDFRGSGL